MAFKAEIIENELHLTIPIGPTVCPLCKVAYPHGFLREMTEEAFTRSGQVANQFVGLLGFCGDHENGIGKWGWVSDLKSGNSYLLCGKCYAPVESAREAGNHEAAILASKLALECGQS